MPTAFEIAARTLRSFYGCWIDTPAVLDIDELFPGARTLEANWRVIRDEALVLLDEVDGLPRFHEVLPDQASISANDAYYWRVFMLRAWGTDQRANQARCPETSRLIGSIDGITSALFSILEPGKHIPAHRGPHRGILRYQLGLSIPTDEAGEPAATLRVDDQLVQWRDGEGILWDDTYEHEVWNRGDTPRVILLLDVLRPDMPRLLRLLDKLVYGSVARSKSLQRVIAKSEVAGAITSGAGTSAATSRPPG